MSSAERMKHYTPGYLPTGWSRLTGGVVRRADGTLVLVYGGHQLVVTVELLSDRCSICVRNRGGNTTNRDLDKMLELFNRSPCVRELRHFCELSKRETAAQSITLNFPFDPLANEQVTA